MACDDYISHSPHKKASSWGQLRKIPFVGIYIHENTLSWGTLWNGELISQSVILPEIMTTGIPEERRIQTLTDYALSYIREQNGSIPAICYVAVPYLTCREAAQLSAVGDKYGIYLRTMRCVSAAAMELSRCLRQESEVRTLIIEYNGSSCETGAAVLGDGIAEIAGIVQRQIREDLPFTFDYLRKDIYKVIDAIGPEYSSFSRIFVSGMLPDKWIRQLEQLFHLRCERLGEEDVLRGLSLQGGMLSGEVSGLLLLDAIDYSVWADDNVILADNTTFPCSASAEIDYRTTRPDHCIDLYLKKNNMVLDTPLHFRLDVSDILNRKKPVQKLEVTVSLDHHELMNLTVRDPDTEKTVVCGWDLIKKHFANAAP